jgi:hypothetical protein
MKIPYRQYWLLQGMNRRLRRSEPHLAAITRQEVQAGGSVTEPGRSASMRPNGWQNALPVARYRPQ